MTDAIFHYCYRMTNNVTGQHYYGSRTSNVPPHDDLGIRYFSSSRYVLSDLETYGKNAFRFKVLKTFATRAAAFAFERRCQERLRVTERTDFYNRSVTPSNGKLTMFGLTMTESAKKKLSEAAKARGPWPEERKRRVSDTLKRQMANMTTEERSTKYGNFGTNNPFYGKTHSEDTRRHLAVQSRTYNDTHGNAFAGRTHTEETKALLRQRMNERLRDNPEIYANTRKPRAKFPCERCGTLVSRGMYTRWHADGKCDPDRRADYVAQLGASHGKC